MKNYEVKIVYTTTVKANDIENARKQVKKDVNTMNGSINHNYDSVDLEIWQESISFTDAISSGKKFKVRHSITDTSGSHRSFTSADFIKELGTYSEEIIQEILTNGKFYID